MNPSVCIQNSLPSDIALQIASSLQVLEVCSLASCSRFWREICGSNCVWESLCRNRWPALALDEDSSALDSEIYQLDQQLDSDLKGWRGLYIKKHNDMAGKAALVLAYAETHLSSDSIEVGYHLQAAEFLFSMQFGFKDVQMFFLKPNISVLLNLIGLHYCIAWLSIPVEDVIEALIDCKISERVVCVQWWKLGRWFYGFRLRDELHSRNVALADLVTSKEEEVLGVLQRGAMHEVLRVQISAVKPTCTSWSCQNVESRNK